MVVVYLVLLLANSNWPAYSYVDAAENYVKKSINSVLIYAIITHSRFINNLPVGQAAPLHSSTSTL